MQLPNPEQLLLDITAQIQAQLRPSTALVGIHRGGVWIMQRILSSLPHSVPHGTLDAAFYRDDYAKRGLKANTISPNINFEVENTDIILIDDIFYTGRTSRAAMNELFDYGRPASITLAVLINRGGAQLPIQPQITGAQLALKPEETLQLSQDTSGKLHLAIAHV